MDMGEVEVASKPGTASRRPGRVGPRSIRAVAHPASAVAAMAAVNDPIRVIDSAQVVDPIQVINEPSVDEPVVGLPVAPAELEIWNSTFFTTAGHLTHSLVALILLVLASPVLLVLALAVKLDSPGPVFYVQSRYGVGGKRFGCLKFRTMVVDAEARLEAMIEADPAARNEWTQNCKLAADPRITRLGNFMRKTSLDELPQLINVVRGDMNLVGPRPVIGPELEWFGPTRELLLSVRPGMTGLWQISGRSDTTRGERVNLDLDYAMRRSPGLDLWILWRTVVVLLRPSKSGAR